MPREGWTKLSPGELRSAGYSPTSERYRSPSGEIVSRRQYDNSRYSDTAFHNRSQFERRHADATYSHFIRKIAQAEGTTRKAIDKPTSSAAQLLQRAKETGYGKQRRGRGKNSPMAKVLVRAGLRDKDATYQVGATPPRK